ncbi:MAG: RluA family pseudouridine synthase, partial [Proteobacteria bacterium]|nr:RluA family pseudouridine synthase [Pseudomonadota bacterium]
MDSFLTTHLPQLTRSRIKQLISDGLVSSSSGKPVKPGQKIRGDETFEVSLPEARPIEALPEDIPLNVLYEDSDIIVIDKPAGMVVHPAAGHFQGTLVNALLFHCKDLSGIGGMLRPGIVHRLDKGTSGVMLATKNDQSHNAMAKQFKSHSISRKYRALIYGQIASSGTVDLPLGRNPNDRKKIAVINGGREAVTHWKLLASYQGLSLVELTLETGRTHQIRVHLSH